MDLPEIEFGRIRPIGSGGQREAFEQFVCELAATDAPDPGARFVRLEGVGGDGGVECFWTLPGGGEHGWQAKFWTDRAKVDKGQLDKSVESALATHPNLVKYIIAIPVDPTGPTAGKGKSLYEKVLGPNGWVEGWTRCAATKGMTVEFRVEWRTDLISRLRAVDTSGVRARYWFDADLLADSWWKDRFGEAVKAARPRYIPELTVEVPAALALAAICGDPSWQAVLDEKVAGLHACLVGLTRSIGPAAGEALSADVPAVRASGDLVVAALQRWRESPCSTTRGELDTALQAARAAVTNAERAETEAMTRRHGDGWDTPGWRQFQAEYQVSFPAAPVDALRELRSYLDELMGFLVGPFDRLAGCRSALLTGAAGRGKTFVACDAVRRRLTEGRPSLFLHGRWFGAGEPLLQLRDRIQLPGDLTGEEVLALLDQAGRAAGSSVLVVIDALNETSPRTMWREHLDRLVAIVHRFDHLRVVFTVRSHYHSHVVPTDLTLPTFVHQGFEGLEFEAVMEYADYYGLEPPTAPPIHGEFDNPLFLRLLCEALKGSGRLSLDQASMGIDELVRLLLRAANDRISDQLSAPRADRIVHQAMLAFARSVAAADKPWLDRATANTIVRGVWPDHTVEGSLLEALIAEGLLAEDVDPADETDGFTVVVAAFERLGHHLVATEAVSGLATVQDVHDALREGNLGKLLGVNGLLDRGLLEALAVAVAHRYGVELTRFDGIGDSEAVLTAIIAGLPWRTTASISNETRETLIAALRSRRAFPDAMDMLFRLAVKPDHPLNADFMHDFLRTDSMAARDAYLVPWLHGTHASGAAVDRLITWGRGKDIEAVGRHTCRLWVTALLWCTGCTDRRVRDHATVAAARLLSRHAGEAPTILERFLGVSDDWIAERACYASYTALLRAGGPDDWRSAAQVVWQSVFDGNPPTNAAIRDEARAIIEAAASRSALSASVNIPKTRPPFDSPWPIEWPDAEATKAYDRRDYPKLLFSCTGDDFFIYQIEPAFRDVPDINPEAIGRRIVQDVVDMGYDPSLHAPFDDYLLRTFGGGRAKPKWMERIGKKYQWIALARVIGAVNDHKRRKRGRWDPPAPPVPGPQWSWLRQLDPTVCEPPVEPGTVRLWVPPYAWADVANSNDEDWVADDSDLPDIAVDGAGDSVSPHVVLSGSYEWEGPEQANGCRRRIWTHVATVLVHTSDLSALIAELDGRNLAGHEVFRGPMYMSGFVGEYPYGHHNAATQHVIDYEAAPMFSVPTLRGTYDILGEYEYAPDDLEPVSLPAPAPKMFPPPPGSLRWDGRSAWVDSSGRLVASTRRALGGGGEDELTIDRSWLDEWLRVNDLAVVWIEMAGKDVYSDRFDYSPGRLLSSRVRYQDPAGLGQLVRVCERISPREL